MLAEYRATIGKVSTALEVIRTGKCISLIYVYRLALGLSVL